MEKIISRLANLRKAMIASGVSAYIIPGTDPHASEYIASCWKVREWISGFDGSAGTAVVTLNQAGVWTDSRYFLQGEQQLAGTEFELMKQGMPETPDYITWISGQLKSGEKVAVDSQLFSVNAFASMKSDFEQSGIELVSYDFFTEIWDDRPSMPLHPFFIFDVKYTGRSVADKLADLRLELQRNHSDLLVLSALDDIAWLFNVRGKDVEYNPVTIAYAVVSNTAAVLYVSPEKATDETRAFLESEGVHLAPYDQIFDDLQGINANSRVMIDGAKLNQWLYEAIPATCGIVNKMSPVYLMKSVKNEVELEGFKRAMVKDGVALTRFYMWLEEHVDKGETEYTIAGKLCEFRSQQENFVGESFASISSYASNGAIVHYKPAKETALELRKEGILLLDSGGQYLDGTTDITRTIALSEASEQQKTDFTLVLKGNIGLSMVQFPINIRGALLDVLARKALWDAGLNYGHGTGHGIGHFLNVHEGPQSIRMEENPVVLKAGMIMSNEPGLYRAGEYGIRVENLVHIVPSVETAFGSFLRFEVLTLYPIDLNLVRVDLLSDAELNWLNSYHQKVYDALSPQLNENEQMWLQTKCRSVSK